MIGPKEFRCEGVTQLCARVCELNKQLRPMGTRPSGVARADGALRYLSLVKLISFSCIHPYLWGGDS